MLVHLCLSVLLTLISLIVFICTVTYELINDDDDDDEHITKTSYNITRQLSYRKEDRVMRPIYGCPEKF